MNRDGRRHLGISELGARPLTIPRKIVVASSITSSKEEEKRKLSSPQARVYVLGTKPIQDHHLRILARGPKFGFEPRLSPAEKLGAARAIARCVPEERSMCLGECVDYFSRDYESTEGPRQVKTCD
ncbi:hypothetical protein MTO96_037476 [Rhipicephalus appendiculatus]